MSLTKSQSNRINAKQSTGPKTEAGKSAIKFNALKLGIYTKDVVLPTEDPAPYHELLAAFRREYTPETPTEIYLIDNVVTSIWRRRRVQAAEVGLHDLQRCEQAERIAESFNQITTNEEMANAMRADFANTHMFSELWRHDARLERSISRSLKELQRLKNLRPNEPGNPVPPPAPASTPNTQQTENQKEEEEEEQSQNTPTATESTASHDQPIQAADLPAAATTSNQPQTECTHKHFLSKSPIAFGGDLS